MPIQSKVDIDIAVEIMNAVIPLSRDPRHKYQKIVLITGDQDFCPVLKAIEGKAKIWIVTFEGNSKHELIAYCGNGGFYFLNQDIKIFSSVY